MRAVEVNGALVDRIEEVLGYLLPNGRREGHEWCVGSVQGEAGSSLKVHLTGSKAGVWSDFATGETGDLFGLWMAVRGCEGVSGTRRDAMDWLGIAEPEPRAVGDRPTYRPPKRQEPIRSAYWRAWLTEERAVPLEVVKRYRVYAIRTPDWAKERWPAGPDALAFPYYDPDGVKVFEKYRAKSTDGKKPKVIWGAKEGKPTLFGWQAIDRTAREVVICEGETDTLAMAGYGYQALGIPFGAGDKENKHKWIANDYEHLAGFDTIYLAMDMDAEGISAANYIAQRLGRERCKVLKLPHKDVGECRVQGVTFEQMAEILHRAQTLDPDQLRPVEAYRRDVIDLFGIDAPWRHGVRLPWVKVGDRLVLRMGEVSLWGGVAKHGKTRLVNQIMIEAISQGWRCCASPLEFRPHRFLYHVVRQIAGGPNPTLGYVKAILDWLHDKLWLTDRLELGKGRVDALFDVMTYAVRRYGIELFVIDPLTKLGIAEDDYNRQKAFIEQLTHFSEQYQVHVILVAHMRKGKSEQDVGSKWEVRGAGALTDLVHTICIVWRNKKKQQSLKSSQLTEVQRADYEKQPDAVVAVEGQREATGDDDEPRIPLWFDPESQTFLESPMAKRRLYVEWKGPGQAQA